MAQHIRIYIVAVFLDIPIPNAIVWIDGIVMASSGLNVVALAAAGAFTAAACASRGPWRGGLIFLALSDKVLKILFILPQPLLQSFGPIESLHKWCIINP